MNLAIRDWTRITVNEAKSDRQRVCEGEVLRLARSCARIRVESGCIWVTWNGEDVVLQQGDEFGLVPGQDHAVITTLDCSTAVIMTR